MDEKKQDVLTTGDDEFIRFMEEIEADALAEIEAEKTEES